MPFMHIHPMHVSDHVFEVLAHALSAEPKIAASRNTPDNLRDLYERHLAVVLMEGVLPIGFIADWHTKEGTQPFFLQEIIFIKKKTGPHREIRA